jgi:phosphate-selective porin OprO/OprP
VGPIAGGDSRTAAGVLAAGERWNVSAVVAGNTVTNQTFDEQLSFLGRAAVTPVKSADALIHLGLNTTVVINPAASGPDVAGAAATPIRLRDRPEIRVDGTRLFDTGNIDSNGLTSIGGEFAGQYRNFSAQAEYFDIKVDRKGPLSNPHFNGWYVQGAWTITGEPRRYAMGAAGFDTPRPAKVFNPKTGQWGAWELALRYTDLDLNHHPGAAGTVQAADAVRGGEQKIVTLGLNWYPNSAVRFLLNVQDVSVDRLSPGGTAFGAAATPPAGAQVGQDFQVYSLRTQYAF